MWHLSRCSSMSALQERDCFVVQLEHVFQFKKKYMHNSQRCKVSNVLFDLYVHILKKKKKNLESEAAPQWNANLLNLQ